mmetsp:Transcript_7443/g.15606  ORF Transcript_7443/g.15606 Transcript_7443/m.15606 type:complete len:248 (+) Transcript_7443:2104-2847(+)
MHFSRNKILRTINSRIINPWKMMKMTMTTVRTTTPNTHETSRQTTTTPTMTKMTTTTTTTTPPMPPARTTTSPPSPSETSPPTNIMEPTSPSSTNASCPLWPAGSWTAPRRRGSLPMPSPCWVWRGWPRVTPSCGGIAPDCTRPTIASRGRCAGRATGATSATCPAGYFSSTESPCWRTRRSTTWTESRRGRRARRPRWGCSSITAAMPSIRYWGVPIGWRPWRWCPAVWIVGWEGGDTSSKPLLPR